MSKIVFFELKEWEKNYIEKHFKKYDIKFFDQNLNDIDLEKIKDVEILGLFIYSKITKEVLDKLSKLKYIATYSTGFDHIDIAECKKRNIQVSNVPFYGENTVAEHTFALILTISRRIYECYNRVQKGDFSYEDLVGFDLKGKTIGIVGMGHIGSFVAKIANGFDMKVLAFDLKQDTLLAKKNNFEYTDFESLLSKSDIVTLHVPYCKSTHHLINSDNIYKIKKGAIVINTSRGGVLQTEALLHALEKKHLSGAGLDVLEGECDITEEKELLTREPEKVKACNYKVLAENHILIDMPNVIVTPHNAFNSQEALLRILDTTIENINSYLKGKVQNSVLTS